MINILKAFYEEVFDDKNGSKADAIYKKDEPIAEEDKEDLYDEDNCKFEGNFKKVLLDTPDEDICGEKKIN